MQSLEAEADQLLAQDNEENNKTVKYNEQCYGVNEKMIDCKKSNETVIYT